MAEYFSGKYLSVDCSVLYFILNNELRGSPTGTRRRQMYEKGYDEKQAKGSYSITIGHVAYDHYLPSIRKRQPSTIYKKMWKTKLYEENPEIMRILQDFGRLYFPEYEFTDAQINYNWGAPPHKDKGNYGDSIIIGLGNYSGGELCLQNDNDEFDNHDIHYRLLKFNGAKYTHYVLPYSGDRMSVVFYNINKEKI